MKRLIILAILLQTCLCFGKVDLVTLPERDTVQLTIYNSADLTLARESRALTLREGFNDLQFSWANTLIDPTSLEMMPLKNGDAIEVYDISFPPRVKNLGLWKIDSETSGDVPFEINYLTSGLSWRAFYMGTLSKDESTMQLQGYVVVTNNSGEDYENAQVRLIVGKVNLIDRIADLARRENAYGSPVHEMTGGISLPLSTLRKAKGAMVVGDDLKAGRKYYAKKEIAKEGLSEYYLYTIEGKETVPHGWSKRLESFDSAGVPVKNLYKFEEERYGNQVIRFLSFKNDKDHKLGETPIPGGMLKVYRGVGDNGNLGYTGQSSFKYIPVEEDVELNLGSALDVKVEPKVMDFRTDNYAYNDHRNIAGWEEVRRYQIEATNARDIPVKLEIKRNFNQAKWNIEEKFGDYGNFKKYDSNSVKFTLELEPGQKKTFGYVLRTKLGTRRD